MKKTLSTAAACACAAVLLTACGGGESGDSGKIEGADSSPSASASASSPGEDRPKIELPEDVKLVFEETETGDPVKDAILKDNEQRLRALDLARIEHDPQHPALMFYSRGEAQASAHRSVTVYKDAGMVVTGTERIFDRKVRMTGDNTAELRYCADESKAFAKDKKTGKVRKTPVKETSYVSYITRLAKNKAGVWQTTGVISKRGAAACQPS